MVETGSATNIVGNLLTRRQTVGSWSVTQLAGVLEEDAIAEAKERGIYSGKEHTNVVQAQEGSMMTSKVEEYRAALSRITDDQV